jgi:hypothetical protein
MELRDRARQLIPSSTYPLGAREAWKLEAGEALSGILGESHPLLDDLALLWTTKVEDSRNYESLERFDWRQALGIMNAAIASYAFMKHEDPGINRRQ